VLTLANACAGSAAMEHLNPAHVSTDSRKLNAVRSSSSKRISSDMELYATGGASAALCVNEAGLLAILGPQSVRPTSGMMAEKPCAPRASMTMLLHTSLAAALWKAMPVLR
jgi:hypothetical protein